ncbi:MAG: SDR family NAD(P)-dependent oxidoreductase, partial [Myxococcales bacterium]|nr:SDR family NAD(P)-dependent oxidoreductase [Myxococcales bacterium]
MRILIAGCGYVGSAFAARRVAQGDEVFGLRRRPVDLPAGVKPVAVD